LGGLLGDFVRGPIESLAYAPQVRRGIGLHRANDVFTDAHPQVRSAKALLPPPYWRYAGIALDMWFDHRLARDFSRWSG
jgi:acyl carrier protein phosphodiesterase